MKHLDLLCPRVYRKINDIPPGKVSTYKEVANSLGVKCYRQVGRALALNPFAPDIPCHRVVRSDGSLGGYSGPGGICAKERLLQKEGVSVRKGKITDLKKFMFRFEG